MAISAVGRVIPMLNLFIELIAGAVAGRHGGSDRSIITNNGMILP